MNKKPNPEVGARSSGCRRPELICLTSWPRELRIAALAVLAAALLCGIGAVIAPAVPLDIGADGLGASSVGTSQLLHGQDPAQAGAATGRFDERLQADTTSTPRVAAQGGVGGAADVALTVEAPAAANSPEPPPLSGATPHEPTAPAEGAVASPPAEVAPPSSPHSPAPTRHVEPPAPPTSPPPLPVPAPPAPAPLPTPPAVPAPELPSVPSPVLPEAPHPDLPVAAPAVPGLP